MADVGTGITIAFATSGWTGELLNVDGPGMTRASVDTSHMGTTNSMTFMPGDLVDRGEIGLEFAFDPDDDPPVDGAAETVTITWPIPAGLSNGATWVGSAFWTAYSPTGSMEERMTASATLKVSGDVTITAAT